MGETLCCCLVKNNKKYVPTTTHTHTSVNDTFENSNDSDNNDDEKEIALETKGNETGDEMNSSLKPPNVGGNHRNTKMRDRTKSTKITNQYLGISTVLQKDEEEQLNRISNEFLTNEEMVQRLSYIIVSGGLFLLVLDIQDWSQIPVALSAGALLVLGFNRPSSESQFLKRIPLICHCESLVEDDDDDIDDELDINNIQTRHRRHSSTNSVQLGNELNKDTDTIKQSSIHIPTKKRNLFTWIQIGLTLLLFVVTFIPYTIICFPFMLYIIIWLRYKLSKSDIFELHDLYYMDG